MDFGSGYYIALPGRYFENLQTGTLMTVTGFSDSTRNFADVPVADVYHNLTESRHAGTIPESNHGM